MEKRKVVTEYSKLSEELLTLFEETYPTGIAGKTIRFPNSKGEIVTAVRLETEDTIYLVKVMAKPKEVLTDEQMDEMVKPKMSEKDEELEEAETEEEEPEEDKPTDDGDEED
ncbi:MAG: DNA primase [Bacteroidota bacterium]|jgi:hypothetical protein